MARIAKGVKRYVIDAASPFIVPVTHAGDARVHGADEPLRTVTTAQRGEHALVTPFVSAYYGRGAGGDDPHRTGGQEPLRTATTENRHAVVAPFVTKFVGGLVRPDTSRSRIRFATIGTANGFAVEPGLVVPTPLTAWFALTSPASSAPPSVPARRSRSEPRRRAAAVRPPWCPRSWRSTTAIDRRSRVDRRKPRFRH